MRALQKSHQNLSDYIKFLFLKRLELENKELFLEKRPTFAHVVIFARQI